MAHQTVKILKHYCGPAVEEIAFELRVENVKFMLIAPGLQDQENKDALLEALASKNSAALEGCLPLYVLTPEADKVLVCGASGIESPFTDAPHYNTVVELSRAAWHAALDALRAELVPLLPPVPVAAL